MKKNNRVQALLDTRKIAYGVKESKFGETIYQCVLFRRIAKITETSNVIFIEFPFGEHPKRKFDNLQDFEYYIDGGDINE